MKLFRLRIQGRLQIYQNASPWSKDLRQTFPRLWFGTITLKLLLSTISFSKALLLASLIFIGLQKHQTKLRHGVGRVI